MFIELCAYIYIHNYMHNYTYIYIYIYTHVHIDRTKYIYSMYTVNSFSFFLLKIRFFYYKHGVAKFVKEKRREPSFEMTSYEEESWKELILPKGKLVDQYKYIKESGGSGGLDRFELLIEKDGQLIWLEAKEWEVSGVNVGLKTEPPSFERRLKHVLVYDQPQMPSFTINYNDKTFFIREINASHIGLTIDGLSKSEMKDMFLDGTIINMEEYT